MQMQFIEIPEFPILRGEEAVKALNEFIIELKEQRGKELTAKQTKALIKLAKGLIHSIETETRASTSGKNIKRKGFATQLKKAIMRHIPEPVRANENDKSWK
jgi:hypothetical protein